MFNLVHFRILLFSFPVLLSRKAEHFWDRMHGYTIKVFTGMAEMSILCFFDISSGIEASIPRLLVMTSPSFSLKTLVFPSAARWRSHQVAIQAFIWQL